MELKRMIVKRTKLNFWERLYVPAVVDGLQDHRAATFSRRK